jgi:tRNA pseudouridine38-40 synthase
MKNIKLTIQYEGTNYRGWQKQKGSDKTIQGKLENVLSKMTGEEITLIGSGRTDAGVHAEKQIANFKMNSDFDCEYIINYCNDFLPQDIAVIAAKEMHPLFHARYNAKTKTYRYNINNNPIPNLFQRNFCYHVEEKLNIALIKEASQLFIGEHDFRAFTTLKNKKKSTVRTIYDIKIIENYENLQIYIIGNGFLHNMVRIITGTLIEVGLGKLNKDEIPNIFEEKARSSAGFTAPPQGLALIDVTY